MNDTGRKKPDHSIPPKFIHNTEPTFKKEGELIFISPELHDTLTRIDIEIADNQQERTQGLMHRSRMADTTGMLFIFEESSPQSFWMKNTKIALDIIFVDENKKIVAIQENTIPYSQAPVSSGKNALFVVEVIAGFCGKYEIHEGHVIAYIRK